MFPQTLAEVILGTFLSLIEYYKAITFYIKVFFLVVDLSFKKLLRFRLIILITSVGNL